MREHVIRVRGRVATCQDRSFVQGTVSADRVSLDLDDEWVGLTCTVTFVSASDNITPPMSDDGTWLVPHEMTDAVAPFGVLVEGSDGTQLVKSARMERPLLVYPSDSSDGSGPTEPTLTEWRQAYELALSARCERVVATTLPSGSEATAEFGDHVLSIGVPRGERGLQGAQGPQGVKGDPFTYDDFTQAQILELQRPATEAAALANQAVTDAKTAIAEVKATEAKLYPAAENILKGTVKDAFVHVDDAFAGAALREITVEGACRQVGTPSPDNPVPIQVIENPVVKVAGRNLLDSKYPAYVAAYNNGFAIINKYSYANPSVALPFTTGPRSSDGFGFIEKLKPDATYTLKAFNAPGKSIVCIAGYKRVEDINDASNAVWHLKETGLGGPASFSVKEGGECVVFTFAAEWGDGTNKITFPADFKVPVEHGGTATEYKPYASQSLAFTLPAEHPYLAKLSDGTADAIEVDEAGNVELVARVCIDRDVRAVSSFVQGVYYALKTKVPPFPSYEAFASGNGRTTALCSSLPYKGSSASGDGVYRSWNGVLVSDTSGRTKEEIQAEVDKNAPLTVVAAMPETRYPLGKIELPKAQDSVVNVWTDAEITPSTGIEYVRDVNIVVSNLESAIASIS